MATANLHVDLLWFISNSCWCIFLVFLVLKKCILLSSIAEHTAVADHHDSVPNGEDNERHCGGP